MTYVAVRVIVSRIVYRVQTYNVDAISKPQGDGFVAHHGTPGSRSSHASTAAQLSAYSASHLDVSVVLVRLVIFDLGTIKTCSSLSGTTNIRKSAQEFLGA
jgi:hypothetical protein